ncbi:hypothetical protein GDO81_003348 [Engystomops pustulosus]|uniref:Uncharacterized protein n=1 Tax=Engystomops pustulosus TaxID=76066 RepID=A0AAV6ZW28_ENGPU|nr:hypothetical protein GDO81_003348 [Engystomops pustulosus]
MVFSIFGCLGNALHGFRCSHPSRLLVYSTFYVFYHCVVFQYVSPIPSDAFTTAVYIGLTKPRPPILSTYPDFVPVFMRWPALAFHLCVTKTNVVSVLLKNILQHFLKKHRFVFYGGERKKVHLL